MKHLPLIVCVMALAAGGCDDSEAISPGVKDTKRLVIICPDISGSTATERLRYLAAANSLAAAANPEEDELRLIKFGSKAEEFFSGAVENERQFKALLKANILPVDPVHGTDYGDLTQRILKDCQQSKAQDILIVILSDGENDFRWIPGREATYRAACDQLAKDLRIKAVRFWGLNAGLQAVGSAGGPRGEIRSLFSGFGDRLQIRTEDQDVLQ